MTKRTAPSRCSRSRWSRWSRSSPLVRKLAAAAIALPASLLTVAAPSTASAQEWLRDRRYQEGPGLRAGDLEFHPGIGGEIGYDSNWLLRSFKTQPDLVNGDPIEGGIIRITPSLTMSTLSPQRLENGQGQLAEQPFAFRAGVAATYREFLSSRQELRDQRNVSANAFLRLDINQRRPVGFAAFANYQRLIQPQVSGNPDLSFNRNDVTVGGEAIFLPGGGTLDLRAGYQFYGAFFEESNGVPFNNLTHEISIRNRWKFRPRTALFHDTSLRFINYPNAPRAVFFLNDSQPLRTRFGLTGLVTDRFGVLLAAGYGATLFNNPDRPSTFQYDSLNAQAEGTFYLSQGPGSAEPGQVSLLLSTLTFGYVRDFQNSLLANFYTSNKGYLRLVYNFASRAIVQLDGYFEALSFPQPFNNTAGGPTPVLGRNGAPTGDFTNYRVGGVLFSEYRFSDIFGVNATIDYSQMVSDTQLAAGNGLFFDLNWRRIQALVGARLMF